MGRQSDQPITRRAASHVLHVAFQMKSVIEDRIQAETGLLLADNEALLNLAHEDQPLRMSMIAERLILSKGGTTKVIDRLEARGLVARSQDPTDRRALVVEITPEGISALETVQPIVDDAIERYWGQYITDSEAETIAEVARKVVEANTGWVE
jgi:DNA-binding MarR family transcriptional regulator